MNIQEFSQKHNVTQRTLRYYVELGLLIPLKASICLDFEEQCEQDFLMIQRLKECSFTISEIKLWLKRKRTVGVESEQLKRCQGEQIDGKRGQVEEELRQIKQSIQKVDHIIQLFGQRKAGDSKGFHMSFFPLICCPFCKKPLSYHGIHMEENSVISGEGECGCGYRLLIENGIVKIPYSQSFSGNSIAPTDHNRETYNRMPPVEVSSFQKSLNWVVKRLQDIDLSGRVVFENSVDVVCLLSTGIVSLDQRASYIIADSDESVIEDVKRRIESQNSQVKVLYIVSPSLNYPLMPQTIDVLIDFYTSEVLQSFNITSLLDVMIPYLRPEAWITGVYTHVVKGTGTLQKNRRMFKDSYPGRYQLQSFKNAMFRNQLLLLDEMVVNTFEDTNAIPAFQSGDVLGDYAYVGQIKTMEKVAFLTKIE